MISRRDLLFRFVPGGAVALAFSKLPKPDKSVAEPVSPPAPLPDDIDQCPGIYYVDPDEPKAQAPRLITREPLVRRTQAVVAEVDNDWFWVLPSKDGKTK